MKYENNQTLGGFNVYQKTVKRYIALVENYDGFKQLLSIDATDSNEAARVATRIWERNGNVLAISERVPRPRDGAPLSLYEVKTETVKTVSVGGGYRG